jgi:CRISPR/Cas system-associated exonuclease Cas4 (RecB family)
MAFPKLWTEESNSSNLISLNSINSSMFTLNSGIPVAVDRSISGSLLTLSNFTSVTIPANSNLTF